MNKITLLLSLVLAAWAGAKVCEQAYHLQEAYQVILTGNSPANLQPQGASVKLDKSMGNATVLNDGTEYRIITDWDGNGTCDAWVKREVKFAYRKKGDKQFTVQTTGDFSIKINDGEFAYKKPGWDEYWFGFASQVSGASVTLYDAIGKSKTRTQLHAWYGNATLKQTLRSQTGADTGTTTIFYPELTSHPDSAVLRAILVDSMKTKVQSDPKDMTYTLQLIRITYDSLPTPVRVLPVKAKASGFQASQTGNLVLIRPGDRGAAAPSEPLGLFGMMGNKVATLHPTGYLYQWNGKTSFGADAPAGVYFVQSGNRILGKFFYSR